MPAPHGLAREIRTALCGGRRRARHADAGKPGAARGVPPFEPQPDRSRRLRSG